MSDKFSINLESFNIDDGVKNEIQKLIDNEISRLNTEHKKTINQLNNDYTSIKTELETANNTIAGINDISKENEKLQKKISEYDEKIKVITEESLKNKLNSAIDLELIQAGAKDVIAVKPFLNINDISFNQDNQLIGINEQLKKIKADKSYLFNTDNGDNQAGVNNQGGNEGHDYGGYKPISGESIKETENRVESIGAKIGRLFNEKRESAKENNSYWATNEHTITKSTI